jgi:NDP-sugar pyrophosphorylase family protein
MAYIGDGSKWGMKIDYSLEEKPLGTIGPLTLLKNLPENFLVMNGDVLCDLDYKKFFKDHVRKGNKVSVSAYSRENKIDFGVLKFDRKHYLTEFREKPVYHFDVSMGVYALNRSVIEKLPEGKKYGFDDLMLDGIRRKDKIWINPFRGFWLDIGRPEDYQYAEDHYGELKKKLGFS